MGIIRTYTNSRLSITRHRSQSNLDRSLKQTGKAFGMLLRGIGGSKKRVIYWLMLLKRLGIRRVIATICSSLRRAEYLGRKNDRLWEVCYSYQSVIYTVKPRVWTFNGQENTSPNLLYPWVKILTSNFENLSRRIVVEDLLDALIFWAASVQDHRTHCPKLILIDLCTLIQPSQNRLLIMKCVSWSGIICSCSRK